MERPKYIFCILIILFSGIFTCYSQTDYKKTIYDAYINGNMSQWETVIKQIEAENLSLPQKLDLMNYYYGYTAYLIGSNKSKQANVYIKKGEKLADQLLKEYPENASANAYKGSFISFKIALNKLKAVTLGPQSMKYINKAYKLDSGDVQALADKGNMLFYAPGMFGGNKEEAIQYFEKAIRMIEKNEDTENNWFYLNLLTLLAQHYEKLDKKPQAINTYEKILQIEPDFKWVRDELYPPK